MSGVRMALDSNLPRQGKYQFVYHLPCPASPIWVPEPAALPYVVACEALSDPNNTSSGYHFFLPLEPSIRLPNSRGFTLAPTSEVLFPRLLMYIDDVTTFSVKHSLQGAALPQQGSLGKGGQDYDKQDDIVNGLTDPDTFPAWSKEIYGLNDLEKHEGTSPFQLIVEQFQDTLVMIMLVATVVSFVLARYDGDEGGEMGIIAFVEPLVIFLILIVNAIVGIWQENNVEKALETLKEIQSEQTSVIRDVKRISTLDLEKILAFNQ
ncbi:hypothetical protein ACFE04_022794 [Oxalis oulophora]